METWRQTGCSPRRVHQISRFGNLADTDARATSTPPPPSPETTTSVTHYFLKCNKIRFILASTPEIIPKCTVYCADLGLDSSWEFSGQGSTDNNIRRNRETGDIHDK